VSDLHDDDILLWSERQADLSISRTFTRARCAACPETSDGVQPLPLPETCPVDLDELLAPG
jgi:hypothetical protein